MQLAHAQKQVTYRWQDLVKQWCDFMRVAKRRSPDTIRQYRRTFMNFLGDTLLDPWEVTEEDVVAYLADVTPRGGQKNETIKALRSYYTWAEGHGAMLMNPMQRITPKKEKYGEAPAPGTGRADPNLPVGVAARSRAGAVVHVRLRHGRTTGVTVRR